MAKAKARRPEAATSVQLGQVMELAAKDLVARATTTTGQLKFGWQGYCKHRREMYCVKGATGMAGLPVISTNETCRMQRTFLFDAQKGGSPQLRRSTC